MNIIGIGIGIPFNSKARKVKVRDSFNRANSTTSLGVSDTGQVWTAIVGTWGINNNKAYDTSVTAQDEFAVVDSGLSDCIVKTKVTYDSTGKVGLSFRESDANNVFICFLATGNLFLGRKVAGTWTQLASIVVGVVNGTYDVMIVLKGSRIQAYLDGAKKIDVTDTNFNAQTKHGIFKNSTSTNERFDEFFVEEL